jgi:transcriptional regulator with XRE-family HTH domain
MKETGGQLRAKREAMGLSLDEAAAELGISGSQLSRIERGLVESVDVAFALQAKRRFGIAVDAWVAKEEAA